MTGQATAARALAYAIDVPDRLFPAVRWFAFGLPAAGELLVIAVFRGQTFSICGSLPSASPALYRLRGTDEAHAGNPDDLSIRLWPRVRQFVVDT